MLESVYEKYKDNPKVAFLSVSIDTLDQADNAELKDTFRDMKVTIPIARDLKREMLHVFGDSSIPAMALIDADGVVQRFEVGVAPEGYVRLPAILDLLLAGDDIYQPQLDVFRRTEERFARWLDLRAKNDFYAGPLNFAEESIAAEIATRGEPEHFSLNKLWTCDELRGPGNITVVPNAGGPPEIVLVDGSGAIAPGGFGRLGLRRPPAGALAESSGPTFCAPRWTPRGRRIWAASAGGSQEVRLLDQDFKPLVTYPEGTQTNPHAGIGDVQFADLDGDGTPEMCVGYGDVVGVQGVSLAGQRLWANRSLANVLSMAVVAKSSDTDGKDRLLLRQPKRFSGHARRRRRTARRVCRAEPVHPLDRGQ